jgi:ABC-type nitrate/sulfonate/bicarbonate transport system permease component
MKAAPLAIVAVYIWIATGGVKGPYIITFLAICPLCVEGVITALEQIDQRIYYELKLTKVNIFKKFIYIFVPLITPYLFMAVLQSFGLGIKVLVMSEYICQSKNSLGQLIYNYKTNLDFTSLLSILIIIVLIVVIIEMLINHFKNKFKFN